jgi:hypothetical protein
MVKETRGKPAVERIIKELIDNFCYISWQEGSFVVEGNNATLR